MTYAILVWPIGNVASWEVQENIQELKVNPPIEVSSSSYCPKLRISFASEDVN